MRLLLLLRLDPALSFKPHFRFLYFILLINLSPYFLESFEARGGRFRKEILGGTSEGRRKARIQGEEVEVVEKGREEGIGQKKRKK